MRLTFAKMAAWLLALMPIVSRRSHWNLVSMISRCTPTSIFTRCPVFRANPECGLKPQRKDRNMSTLLEAMVELDIALSRLVFVLGLFDRERSAKIARRLSKIRPKAGNASVLPPVQTLNSSATGAEIRWIPVETGNSPCHCFGDAADVPQAVPIISAPIGRRPECLLILRM